MNSVDKILNNMKGFELTEVIAGGSNGSMIILCYTNLFRLFIYCGWRLTQNDELVVGWRQECEHGESPLVTGIKRLERLKLLNYSFNELGDLRLFFEEGYNLFVFADITQTVDSEENWSLCDLEANMCLNLTDMLKISYTPYSNN